MEIKNRHIVLGIAAFSVIVYYSGLLETSACECIDNVVVRVTSDGPGYSRKEGSGLNEMRSYSVYPDDCERYGNIEADYETWVRNAKKECDKS